MAEASDVKTIAVKVLGKDLECKVNQKKQEAVVTMNKGDFDAILAEKGVTKEVRDTVRKAHDDIVCGVEQFEHDFLKSQNKGKKEGAEGFVKSIETRLGKGDGAMSVKKIFHQVHKGMDMNTKKEFEKHHWGRTIVTLDYQFAKELKAADGQLQKHSDELMKMFDKK